MVHLESKNFNIVAKLDYVTFYLNSEKDTIIANYNESIVLTLDKAKEVLQTIAPFKKAAAMYGITDVRAPFIRFNDEAQQYFKENMLPEVIKLHAILVEGLSTRIVANFYAKFHKPKITTKVFSKLDDALSWIDEHKHSDYKKLNSV